jgi:hypothetical protein
MKASQFFLAATLLPTAFAATITLHNTGVNSSDVLVASGAQASFWSLSAEPSGASEAIGSLPFRFRAGSYFADTTSAAWVSPNANGTAGAGGFYTYDLVFNLAGLNPATASISGTFGTDNDGSISLNSNAPVATQTFAGFGTPTAFAFTSGFVAGPNTIHVRVDNGGDPTAFFVQLSGTASVIDGTVPEPGTVALTCVGLLGLLLVRRRIAQA